MFDIERSKVYIGKMITPNFKTPYGMRVFATSVPSMKTDFNNGISHDELIMLHAKTIQDCITGECAPNNDYSLDTSDGQNLTFDDLMVLFSEYNSLLRIRLIEKFEKHFEKYGTDANAFFTRYKTGCQETREIFALTGVFPVEAMNVRAEMHHPSYLMKSAMWSSEKIGFIIPQAILDHDEQISVYLLKKGPFLPPVPEELNEKITRHYWKAIDWQIQNGHIETPKPELPGPNKAVH